MWESMSYCPTSPPWEYVETCISVLAKTHKGPTTLGHPLSAICTETPGKCPTFNCGTLLRIFTYQTNTRSCPMPWDTVQTLYQAPPNPTVGQCIDSCTTTRTGIWSMPGISLFSGSASICDSFKTGIWKGSFVTLGRKHFGLDTGSWHQKFKNRKSKIWWRYAT